ncbi:MAG: mechanosensitive ion channel domain-containing protein [Candidatus Hydrogenedentota bacterium]
MPNATHYFRGLATLFLVSAIVILTPFAAAQEAPAAEAPAEEAPDAEAPAEEAPAAEAPAEEAPDAEAPAVRAELPGGIAGMPAQLATPEELAQALDVVETRLTELRDKAAEAEDDTGTSQRIDALARLKLALQRRSGIVERLREVKQSLEEVQTQQTTFSEEGLVEEPPYAISAIDGLRDERQVIQQEEETSTATQTAREEAVQRAEEALANARKSRRQAREGMEKASVEPARSQAVLAYDLARVDELVAELSLATAQADVLLAKEQGEVIKARLALLDEKIAQAEQYVVFDEEMLAEKEEQIAARRETLEADLDKLRTTRDANESALYDARRALKRAEDEARRAALREHVAAREAWLDASSHGMDYLGQRIAHTAIEQTVWQRRHAMINNLPEVAVGVWRSETTSALAALAAEREAVESRLNNLRGTILSLQSTLANEEKSPADPEAVRSRLRALASLEEQALACLASIANVESVAARLAANLEERVQNRSLAERWAQAVDYVTSFWYHELFVIEDTMLLAGEMVVEERSFTVGRVAGVVLMFFVVLVVAALLQRVLRRFVLPRLIRNTEHTHHLWRDIVLVLIRNSSKLFVLAVALWAAAQPLPWRGSLHTVLGHILTVAVWMQVGFWGAAVLQRVIERNRMRQAQTDPSSVSAYGLLSVFGRVAIWIIIAVTVLWKLDFNIAGIIGALGVGGIAVAFALQNILGDVFSSMAILLDKPFRVGDFIITGEVLGTIEHIGIKTTRVRSLSGEQVVVSNTDLLGSRIHNYKLMEERRVLFGFGVVYQTPPEKLEMVPGIVREIIEGLDNARFDRAHFKAYGDFSLDFEVVYYVLGSEYVRYMDIQQAINLALYRRFQTEGIEFAYPTTEIILRPPGANKEGFA